MIEIFEPGSPEYNRQRADQELGAARAARLMKARAAHLDLAARHLSAARELGTPEGRTGPEDIRVALQSTYRPARDDDESARMLALLGKY